MKLYWEERTFFIQNILYTTITRHSIYISLGHEIREDIMSSYEAESNKVEADLLQAPGVNVHTSICTVCSCTMHGIVYQLLYKFCYSIACSS